METADTRALLRGHAQHRDLRRSAAMHDRLPGPPDNLAGNLRNGRIADRNEHQIRQVSGLLCLRAYLPAGARAQQRRRSHRTARRNGRHIKARLLECRRQGLHQTTRADEGNLQDGWSCCGSTA